MLQEAKNIVQDVKDGNLPANELPAFFFFMIGRTFWFWFLLIIGIVVGFVLGK